MSTIRSSEVSVAWGESIYNKNLTVYFISAGHYLSFDWVFGSKNADYSDQNRPGRHQKQARKVEGIPFKNPTKTQYALNTGNLLNCSWCLKLRAIYTQRSVLLCLHFVFKSSF